MCLLSAPEILALLKRNLPVEDRRDEIIEEIGASHLRMRLPVVPSYVSHDLPPGSGEAVLSGPIAMGFADTALYACIHAFYGADVLAVIVNFNISFLRVAGNADVAASATLLRKGKTLAFDEARLFLVRQPSHLHRSRRPMRYGTFRVNDTHTKRRVRNAHAVLSSLQRADQSEIYTSYTFDVHAVK